MNEQELLVRLVAMVADAVADRLPTSTYPDGPDTSGTREPWRLLDVDELAGRLGRSKRWIHERAKRGEIPTLRLDGGGYLFDVDDVREWARAHRIGEDGCGSNAPDRRPTAVKDGWWRP